MIQDSDKHMLEHISEVNFQKRVETIVKNDLKDDSIKLYPGGYTNTFVPKILNDENREKILNNLFYGLAEKKDIIVLVDNYKDSMEDVQSIVSAVIKLLYVTENTEGLKEIIDTFKSYNDCKGIRKIAQAFEDTIGSICNSNSKVVQLAQNINNQCIIDTIKKYQEFRGVENIIEIITDKLRSHNPNQYIEHKYENIAQALFNAFNSKEVLITMNKYQGLEGAEQIGVTIGKFIRDAEDYFSAFYSHWLLDYSRINYFAQRIIGSNQVFKTITAYQGLDGLEQIIAAVAKTGADLDIKITRQTAKILRHKEILKAFRTYHGLNGGKQITQAIIIPIKYYESTVDSLKRKKNIAHQLQEITVKNAQILTSDFIVNYVNKYQDVEGIEQYTKIIGNFTVKKPDVAKKIIALFEQYQNSPGLHYFVKSLNESKMHTNNQIRTLENLFHHNSKKNNNFYDMLTKTYQGKELENVLQTYLLLSDTEIDLGFLFLITFDKYKSKNIAKLFVPPTYDPKFEYKRLARSCLNYLEEKGIREVISISKNPDDLIPVLCTEIEFYIENEAHAFYPHDYSKRLRRQLAKGEKK